MVLGVLRPLSGVHFPESGVWRPASSVQRITPTVLKIISPYCICRLCAKNIVAPSVILNFMWRQN